MDAFVALLTEEFHDSDWTDQEVGFALGRTVPVIAVKLDMDSYGFIGKFQAVSCEWDSAAVEIAKLLINRGTMLDGLISRVESCPSFERLRSAFATICPAPRGSLGAESPH